MNRWLLAGMALLLAAGLGLRAPRLTLRPMHNDEGVNAMRFRGLYVNRDYKYNPDEYHGPTLAYLTLPAAWLQGGGPYNAFTEATYRGVAVGFGAGLIVLLALLARDLGRAGTLWAAGLTAISPAMVFYSRYYIHEMLLVFFTAWTFICLWRLANSGRAGWAVGGGIGLGMMWATKETFVFALAALALAVGTSGVWGRWREGEAARGPELRWRWPHLAAALAAALATWAVLFSSFGANPAGLLDSLRTYRPWLERVEGASPHMHGWTFYFQRLLYFHASGGPCWSEGFVVALSAAGFLAAWRGRLPLARLIAGYTFWLTLIYTIAPYKTPWCLLGFYHGMLVLAGVGAAWLWRSFKPAWLKAALAVALAAGSGQLGWQCWRCNFGADARGVPYCDSAKNPYVYAQTLPDALRLINTVEALASVSPQGTNTVMEVIAPESYWPMPWYLRGFPKVGYWDKIPDQPPAPIMIVSASLHAALDQEPGRTHLMAGYFELRPQVFMELYVNTNLWAACVKAQPPGW